LSCIKRRGYEVRLRDEMGKVFRGDAEGDAMCCNMMSNVEAEETGEV
jgi:hypothetical protein